jgi:putative ABC transport system permease protein
MENRAGAVRLRSSLSLKLALHHIGANASRLAVTILAVAMGVGLVVAVRLMNATVLASFLGTVDGLAGRAALTITAGEGSTFDETVVDRVSNIPGVRLAVPLVRSVAFPDDSSGELLTVLGVDLTHEASVRVYDDTDSTEDVIEDKLLFLSQPDSIIAGKSWATSKHLSVGSELPLVTPAGVRRFTIRGLIEPSGLGRTLAGRLIVMDLYAAERAFTADGQINQVDVVVAQGSDPVPIKAAIAATLPSGLVVREPALVREVIRTSVAGFQALLTAFALLAVLGGFVICYSRLRTLFEARTWEVGLLRTVGVRQSAVFLELLKEGLLLGAAGVAVGIPLGIAVAHWALPSVAAATAINFRLPVSTATRWVDVGAIAAGAGVGLLAAVSAAVMPALALARTRPVAALRLRGREGAASPPGRSGLIAGILMLAGLVLMVCQRATQVTRLGTLATALFALSLVGLAGPLVQHSRRSLTWLLGTFLGPIGRTAADQLSQQSRRASLAVATLGLGLGSVLLFGILGWSFERSVVAQLSSRFRAHLIVNSPFISGGWMAAPMRDEIVEDIVAVPGVVLASGQHLTEIEYGHDSVSLFSYDPPCFLDPRVCRWPLEGGALPRALDRVGEDDAVIVSASFARQQRIGPGEILSLASPTGVQNLLVAGIAREEPAKAIIMSRRRYANSWNDHMVTWVHVVVARPADEEAVSAEIARRVGQKFRVQVRKVDDFLAYLAGQARQAFNTLYIMEAITLLLVLIGIADALAAGVVDRTRQYGMMRAVGLRRSHLATVIAVEGGTIGLLGLVVAAGAGFGLSLFWVYVQFPALLGWTLELNLPVAFICISFALAFFLSLIGAIAPAIHASRLSVPEALRTE